MKMLKMCMFIFFLATLSTMAQDISNHALGLRLGDSDGIGAEISYQKSIGRSNRVEFNLGWRDSREFDAFKITGLYQWIRQIDGGFNWFYGFGGGLGSVDFEARTNQNGQVFTPDGGLFVFVAGDIGVEYNFDIPLVISLDIKPEIGVLGFSDFSNNFNFDVALGIRYQF